MPEQALYLKWRPALFDQMVGQEHITRTLRNALKSGRIRHAYLFSGPRGTGKTTTARLLAKAVNCQHPDPDMRPCNTCAACIAVNEGRYLDLIEIDAATHTGVDDVRDLRDKIAFSPGEGRYKVYIIDEVHRFSGSAFDALLKTLEEPPDHAIFVLATTE
ncbi:MAG: DNA polymerase III, subunit gamma and tau, partial [Phototrophicales bacterium]